MIIIGKRNIKSITSLDVLGYPSAYPLNQSVELSLQRGNSFREVEQNSFSNKLK